MSELTNRDVMATVCKGSEQITPGIVRNEIFSEGLVDWGVARRHLVLLLLAVFCAWSAVMVVDRHPTYALCSGAGCNGLWPWDTGCNLSGYVVDQASADDFTAFLWYSGVCVANWSTLQFPPNSSLHTVCVNSASPADPYECSGGGAADGWLGTHMVDGNYLAQACGQDAVAYACTGWH